MNTYCLYRNGKPTDATCEEHAAIMERTNALYEGTELEWRQEPVGRSERPAVMQDLSGNLHYFDSIAAIHVAYAASKLKPVRRQAA